MPYLDELINLIVKNGRTYGLITNGVCMSDKLIDLLCKTASHVRVSMETGDKDLYMKYKGVSGDQFDRVVSNVRKLVKGKRTGMEVSLKFDVDNNLASHNHIKDSVSLAHNLGVDIAAFKSMTGKTELTDSEKESASDELNNFIGNYYGKTKFINSIVFKKWHGKCWLNPLHVVVDGRGDCFICCYYYRQDVHKKQDHCIGNMIKTPFKTMWESSKHKEKISKIKHNKCSKVDCKFFQHHRVVESALIGGRVNIL
jgi:molybdenum cofactor biosynthesis enzyme MoaA